MPIQVSIDHAKRVARVTACGEVSVPDIFAYFDQLVVNGAMPYPKLLEARGVKTDFSTEDVLQIGARMKAYKLFEPRGPVALVAQTAAITKCSGD